MLRAVTWDVLRAVTWGRLYQNVVVSQEFAEHIKNENKTNTFFFQWKERICKVSQDLSTKFLQKIHRFISKRRPSATKNYRKCSVPSIVILHYIGPSNRFDIEVICKGKFEAKAKS